MTLIAIYSLLTIGLCLMAGYTGQLTLAHPCWFGIGAYVSAILTSKLSIPPWAALICSAVFIALIAYFIGMLVLRLRGYYFAVATFALLITTENIAGELGTLTGGQSGFMNITFFSIGNLVLDQSIHYYYLAWAFAIIFLVFSLNVVSSRFGRAIGAIKTSELRAESLGIDVAKCKLEIFILGSVFAGISGSIYAHYMRYIEPSCFGFSLLIKLLVMCIIGGLTSVWGALLGSILVVCLDEFLGTVGAKVLPTARGEMEFTIYGLIIVLLLIIMPAGLVNSLRKLHRPLSGAVVSLRSKFKSI
jgi:branched-chain amino acid transport system permease protein